MFGHESGPQGSVAGPRGLSVFCVDPGETTGWAWACVAYKELRSISIGGLSWAGLFEGLKSSERLRWGQTECYRGPLSASSSAARVAMQEAQAVWDLAIEIDQLHLTTRRVSRETVGFVTDIVIEDFILRERTKSRNLLAPVRLTAGLVQEVLRSDKLIGLTFQSPSDAKSVVNDDRLRGLGLWVPGMQHSRDALRHLALWLRRIVERMEA